ncbi:hypothetical protein FB446DRAFT_702753 [Lentinula raphanica]|nr:hypothetical protein FB446DRAFT_702753 [Lentinula raphanica]
MTCQLPANFLRTLMNIWSESQRGIGCNIKSNILQLETVNYYYFPLEATTPQEHSLPFIRPSPSPFPEGQNDIWDWDAREEYEEEEEDKKWRENATAMPMPMGIPVPIVSEPEQQPNAIGAAGGSEGLVNFPIEPQAWAIPQGQAQTPYHASVLPPDSNSNDNDKDSEDEVEAPPMPTPMHVITPAPLTSAAENPPTPILLQSPQSTQLSSQ